MNWLCLPFAELGSERLHTVLRHRVEVFVVEQRCAYPEIDGLDPAAWHLMAWDGDALQAYARLLPPGLKAPSPVIGRVLTTAATRGTGLGHALLAQAVQACEQRWPGAGITLFAQAHLQHFYARAGFVGVGAIFDEDGIPHREMHKTPHTEP